LIPAAALLLAPVAHAAEPEVRPFAVSVDGRHAGEYRLSVREAEDGTVTAESTADVTVRVLVFTYRYTFRGVEVWKDGRLVRLDTTSDDNGTRHTVSAVADRDGLKVTADGKGRTAPADSWPTTYWRLPAGATDKARPVALLEADDGRQAAGRLEPIGPARMMVGGRAVDCVRYRVVGGHLPADLWYDGTGRLVRQETVEDGHRTVLQLQGTR
jgi:hypothetical protein